MSSNESIHVTKPLLNDREYDLAYEEFIGAHSGDDDDENHSCISDKPLIIKKKKKCICHIL